MAQIKVTADVLRSKELEASGLSAEHGEAMEQIRQIVDALSEIWQGDAQNAFQQAFAEFQPILLEFRAALEGYIDLMRITAEEFQRADDELATQMGGGGFI